MKGGFRRPFRGPASGRRAEPARDLPELELRCEGMAAGGRAVARHEGRVVFVAGAAPRETVRARVVADKGRFLEAETVSVVEPSVDRVAPGCRHFGDCGGCAWQYMAYPAQLAAKKDLLEDAFRRLGRLERWPVIEVVSAGPWGGRSRAQFQPPAGPGEGWGFFAGGSRRTVSLRECPVLAPELQGLWERLGDRTSDPLAERRERAAFAWGSRGRVFVRAPGDPSVVAEHEIEGRRFRFEVDGFFQSHAGLLPEFVRRVTGGLEGRLAWDLYAGVGLFAAFLEDRFAEVHAVESDPLAGRHAPENLRRAVYYDAPVEDWLEARLAEGAPVPDAVVVDPPRQGLSGRALEALVALAPPRLRYVSCGHDTLGRDLGRLVPAGWRLESVALFDLAPQTPHLETVCDLVRAETSL